ncbi:hypothetical protein AB0I60_25745 [Actinosynnema sp. NPDC050436]|uniref:hypothetical protein n=1 Tax=Actinosynnema sp. NPDC050436 TaxID=3155659 RepID=UPI0033F6DC0F
MGLRELPRGGPGCFAAGLVPLVALGGALALVLTVGRPPDGAAPDRQEQVEVTARPTLVSVRPGPTTPVPHAVLPTPGREVRKGQPVVAGREHPQPDEVPPAPVPTSGRPAPSGPATPTATQPSVTPSSVPSSVSSARPTTSTTSTTTTAPPVTTEPPRPSTPTTTDTTPPPATDSAPPPATGTAPGSAPHLR